MTDPRVRIRRAALAVYAVSTFLAFPHEWPGGGSFDLGLIFVWLIPASLIVGIHGLSVRDAGRAALGASVVGHAPLFHWFYVVTVSYGGMPWWLGLLSPLLPALYVSVFSALFAMGWAALVTRQRESVWVGAALWVAVDWARAHFLGGFPWATLGDALHLDLPLLGLTRWAGVYVLSFLAAAAGIALARVLVLRSPAAIRTLIGVALVLVIAHALGAGLQPEPSPDSPRTRIAAIQGNIDQGVKWNEERRSRILEKYLRLSESAVEQGAEWVVWPETAVPGFIELDPLLADRLARFARRHEVALFVGGMGVILDREERRIEAFFDSAFVFDPRGALVDRYDKTHLVPFGEFVPLRAALGRFFKALATGLASADVSAGPRPRVVKPVALDAEGVALRVAVPICYELLFPHVMRGFGAEGAAVLLAITNDAWYGRTGAPHQFLAMTAMRAAENGRWVVRAANTGISAIIDDRGDVLEQSALFEDSVIVADVPILQDRRPTFYARFGDVFAWICVVLASGILARGMIENRLWRTRPSRPTAEDEDRGR